MAQFWFPVLTSVLDSLSLPIACSIVNRLDNLLFTIKRTFYLLTFQLKSIAQSLALSIYSIIINQLLQIKNPWIIICNFKFFSCLFKFISRLYIYTITWLSSHISDCCKSQIQPKHDFLILYLSIINWLML